MCKLNVDGDDFMNVSHKRRIQFIAPANSWQRPQTKFNFFFSRYYFKYNGHKMLDCKFNVGLRNFSSKNAFSLFMDYVIECYNHHMLGIL